jgi:hypothetical protein
MKAQILTITASNINDHTEDSSYTFDVFEFENGLIQVPSVTCNDWFFDCRENIECCGNDIVREIVDTGKLIEISVSSLAETIEESQGEFGSIPQKAYELITNAN